MTPLKIIYLSPKSLIADKNNARTHSDEQIKQLVASINEVGFTNPVLIDENKKLIAGHGRTEAAKLAKLKKIPTITLTGLTATQKRAYALMDNKLALNAGWDLDKLQQEVAALQDENFDLDLLGWDEEELADILGPPPSLDGQQDENVEKGKLSKDFLFPPFSVLSARDGRWQERKREWLSLGIKSEEGRGDNAAAAPGGSLMPADKSKFGKCLETGIGEKYGREEMNGTSIFDPVLCELMYLWFSPRQGTILDPFAGGSVRGIVASKLGRHYCGIELRKEQVEANTKQGEDLIKESDKRPKWYQGDSRNVLDIVPSVKADMIFSCPPYADLEVYSDDPQDLSTLEYAAFREAYFDIINKSCQLLKNNRYACFVVGEVRDGDGNYYDFVGDTIKAFKEAGLDYYNEIILVTAVGSLPIRSGKTFSASRKVGKTHQNILVFKKGDAKAATQACGGIKIEIIEKQVKEKYGEVL